MSLGGVPWQDYFQRVLAAKSVRNAQVLSVASGFICMLIAIPSAIVGYVAMHTDWSMVGKDDAWVVQNAELVFPMALQHLTPWLVALIGLGAIAAGVMSSVDASVLSTSGMFAHNVYQAFRCLDFWHVVKFHVGNIKIVPLYQVQRSGGSRWPKCFRHVQKCLFKVLNTYLARVLHPFVCLNPPHACLDFYSLDIQASSNTH